MGKQIGMVDYLVLDDGAPYLRANACTECGALYFDRRNACAKCGKREFEQKKLSDTGSLRAFTIVYRAAPGVPTPYVSAVVDLDGGGVVKSNLVEVDPAKPEDIKLGAPVRMTTFTVATDDDGTDAVAFAFQPA